MKLISKSSARDNLKDYEIKVNHDAYQYNFILYYTEIESWDPYKAFLDLTGVQNSGQDDLSRLIVKQEEYKAKIKVLKCEKDAESEEHKTMEPLGGIIQNQKTAAPGVVENFLIYFFF